MTEMAEDGVNCQQFYRLGAELAEVHHKTKAGYQASSVYDPRFRLGRRQHRRAYASFLRGYRVQCVQLGIELKHIVTFSEQEATFLL